jgi:putative two-component system response regulator
MNLPRENRIVAGLTEIIALECGYSPAKARRIRNAAALHDIGKMKIPESVLNKPGKLTAREFEIIKTHTTLGAELLSSVKGELGEAAKLICLFHHEWNNPSAGGYWGVSLSLLPDYISFAAIADVYVACRSKRPYKDAMPMESALEYIQNQADTQFCPKLVDDFVSLIRNDSRVSAICPPM